jgi:uncharacterized protein (DUF1697 family)
MPRFFAFLRAINAGPERTVKMNVLLQAFESLGFRGVTTFLGSGNVVFETRAKVVGMLERKIERRLQQIMSYSVPVFIRTHPELNQIATLDPFGDLQAPGADVNIILLADNLDKRSKMKLIGLRTETDGFSVHGREIYWWRRKKPGTSLYSTVPLTKVLTQPFTIRSRNTIRRLAAKFSRS